MRKVQIIRLLAFALSFSLLTVPVQNAQAATALGNTWVSNSGSTNFTFSDITINKSNFLTQSESVTVSGILKSDTGGTPAALVGATVTLRYQKVDPTSANANVGSPTSVTVTTGADGIFSESITAPLAGKYFITLSVDDGPSDRTVKITNADNSAFFIYSFNGGPGVSISAPSSIAFGAAANLDIQLTVFGGAALANETVTVSVWNTGYPTEIGSADFISDSLGDIEVVIPAPNYDTVTVKVTTHASNVDAGDFSLMPIELSVNIGVPTPSNFSTQAVTLPTALSITSAIPNTWAVGSVRRTAYTQLINRYDSNTAFIPVLFAIDPAISTAIKNEFIMQTNIASKFWGSTLLPDPHVEITTISNASRLLYCQAEKYLGHLSTSIETCLAAENILASYISPTNGQTQAAGATGYSNSSLFTVSTDASAVNSQVSFISGHELRNQIDRYISLPSTPNMFGDGPLYFGVALGNFTVSGLLDGQLSASQSGFASSETIDIDAELIAAQGTGNAYITWLTKQYFVGSAAVELLIAQFGITKYLNWMQARQLTNTGNAVADMKSTFATAFGTAWTTWAPIANSYINDLNKNTVRALSVYTGVAPTLSTVNTLATFSVNGTDALTPGTSLDVSSGTTSVTIVATPTYSAATRVISGATGLVSGSNTVSVVVTAEDGTSSRTYTVAVVVASAPSAPAPSAPAPSAPAPAPAPELTPTPDTTTATTPDTTTATTPTLETTTATTPTPDTTTATTPTPEPTPEPTTAPVKNKSTYFATTLSTKNLTKVTLKSATARISTKVGKSLQIKIPTVGTKRVAVRVAIKDPSGKSYSITSTTVEKNMAYSMPKLNFAKPGLYTISLYLGSLKKTVTVKVAP